MKILKIKVKVKSSTLKDEDLPDWGQGPGILISQEVKFDDTGLDPHRIAVGINELYHNLLKDVVEPVIEELN